MKIIFQIDGGLGKCIAATAVCRAIKTQYPTDELIVVSGYPEVFLCNPNVDLNLGFGERAYFYKNHIMDQSIKMCLHNPYLETDFINLNGHLIQVWCNMFGIKHNGEGPELFITNREIGFYSNMFAAPKPLFVVQTNGGGTDQPNKYSWSRDLPIHTAQQIVNVFANDFTVVHIRRQDQLELQNTIPVFDKGFRPLCVLLMMSQKRLLIDSFAQHAAAALSLPSVVCWVTNTPSQFGYNNHTNIIANAPTIKQELRHSVFSKYNISGEATEFPYHHEGEIFDAQLIYNALLQTPAPQNTHAQQPVDTLQSDVIKNVPVVDDVIIDEPTEETIALNEVPTQRKKSKKETVSENE